MNLTMYLSMRVVRTHHAEFLDVHDHGSDSVVDGELGGTYSGSTLMTAVAVKLMMKMTILK